MKILLLEDDAKSAQQTSRFLSAHLHHVVIATTKQDGLEKIHSNPPEVVIADRMLPDGSGIDFIREIRSDGIMTPVIITSVLGDTSEKITGLNAGADDYLSKPFSPEELVARIDSVLRRTGNHDPDSVVTCADLRLDPSTMTVERHGIQIPLRKGEFELLGYFMRNAGQMLSAERIIRDVWKFAYLPGSSVLETRICALRKKLNAHGGPDLIHNKRNIGYIFGDQLPAPCRR